VNRRLARYKTGASMEKRRVKTVSYKFLPKLALAGAAFAVLFSGLPARAALGGDTASIEADQAQMQGTRKTTAMGSYTIHEIEAANGTVVREYQSQGGTVFAVAWHGPFAPDVRQILGGYFDQYTKALKVQSNTPRVRRPIMVNEPGLAIELSGHPRWFVGKVYVPEQLPVGLQAEDIR
jgi:Protein of unknown function (DUF2844)